MKQKENKYWESCNCNGYEIIISAVQREKKSQCNYDYMKPSQQQMEEKRGRTPHEHSSQSAYGALLTVICCNIVHVIILFCPNSKPK